MFRVFRGFSRFDLCLFFVEFFELVLGVTGIGNFIKRGLTELGVSEMVDEVLVGLDEGVLRKLVSGFIIFIVIIGKLER